MSLATLLFSDYRRKVLGLLLLHPDQRYHLREIARRTATQPGTLARELNQLTYRFSVPDILFFEELEAQHSYLLDKGLALGELSADPMSYAMGYCFPKS